MRSLIQPQKSRHWQAFLIALATAAVIFIPYMIYNRGYFIYIGDFNVQQIPFYKLAHEAVRSGDIFWSWYTDLGANFIGSYSFYLIFSPFFWLTLPFPTEFVPHLMGPLLMLKTACAALTSYCYIQRFVKDKQYALLGSLLYAFSGFTAYNIFFNHFHEAIVFFPLMLVGLEELLVNNRRGLFAVSVAVNAIVNYWFFVGEVVFVILYYFIRCSGMRGGYKKLPLVAAEAVLGCLVSMFALLPSALAVMGNPRTTFPANMLGGWQFWLYTHEQRQPGILASFFFPPETPSRPNMFPDHGAKWASLSAWLPLFSMSGVLAFLISARKSWLRKLIITCAFIAMVPGLNSLFVGLNHSYYTRWFYMLVLMLSLATAVTLDNTQIDFWRGFRWTALVTAGIILAIGLTPVFKDDQVDKIGLAKDMQIFWVYAAMAALSLLLCYIIMRLRDSDGFARALIFMLAVFSAGYTLIYLGMSKGSIANDNSIIDYGIKGRAQMDMPALEDGFYRTDIYDSGENFGMYWHLPNIQCFHSVVPISIMEFYPDVGVKRDVSSRPQPEVYALRSLFSVKYLFIEDDKDEKEPMPGYQWVERKMDWVDVYENENFVPMGFTFDKFITLDDFYHVPEENRHKLLMRALVLTDEQAQRYGGDMEYINARGDIDLNYTSFLQDVNERRAASCYDFQKDNRGFTARSNLGQGGLMFFSVPFEKGWSATVNGEPAQIEKVDIGFMAVEVPAGETEIRFNYMTPGLLPGLAVSGGAAVILALYWLFSRKKAVPPGQARHYALFDGLDKGGDELESQISLEDYVLGSVPLEPPEPYRNAKWPRAGFAKWDGAPTPDPPVESGPEDGDPSEDV